MKRFAIYGYSRAECKWIWCLDTDDIQAAYNEGRRLGVYQYRFVIAVDRHSRAVPFRWRDGLEVTADWRGWWDC